MKIAKKVLALVMAIAVIGCSAAMAFAAPDNAKAALTIGEVVDGKFDVVLSIQNCLDLTAGDLIVGYDVNGLEFVPFNAKLDSKQCETLADASAFTLAGNTFNGMGNAKEIPGQVKFGFNFLESLDAETWGVDVDMADVKLFKMTFKVVDAAKAELTLTGALKFLDGSAVEVNETFGEKEEPTTAEPTTAEPTTAEPTTAEPTTAEPTTAEPTEAPEAPSTPDEVTTEKGETDNGPTTGDTGVLAIAAGVVALAGAAFVVSKKRK